MFDRRGQTLCLRGKASELVWIYYESMALNRVADKGPCLCQVSSLIRDFHVCGNYSVCWWQPVGPLGIHT